MKNKYDAEALKEIHIWKNPEPTWFDKQSTIITDSIDDIYKKIPKKYKIDSDK